MGDSQLPKMVMKCIVTDREEHLQTSVLFYDKWSMANTASKSMISHQITMYFQDSKE